MALELNASKHRIYEYVESRMSFIAPNLSIIIGASTAAKIMGEVLGQSGGRGPTLDSVIMEKPHPSCMKRGIWPRAPVPCSLPVIPPGDHRGRPACLSCRPAERMVALRRAGLTSPEEVVWLLGTPALLGQHVPAAPGSAQTPGLPSIGGVSHQDHGFIHEMGTAVLMTGWD